MEGAVEGSAKPEEAVAQESIGGKHVLSLKLKETHDYLALQQAGTGIAVRAAPGSMGRVIASMCGRACVVMVGDKIACNI